MTPSALQFREISCIVLGAITGFLIGLPWALQAQGAVSIITPLLFAACGGLVGFRQRRNTLFFYLCLVCVVALASLLSRNLFA